MEKAINQLEIEKTVNHPDVKKNSVKWDNWPATAYQEVGHPLITKGTSFFSRARELYFAKDASTGKTLMDEFIQIYKNRPDPVNICGIRINHAMALYLTVKQLQPTLVVESGVNAGISTYFIRAASKTTKIFAIDPLDKPICGQNERWMDSNVHTKYYTGDTFVDLLDLDWNGMIARNEVDVEKSLIFIDDHLRTFNRMAGLMKHGFRHFLIEDNYKHGEGASSPDKRRTPKQIFHASQYRLEANWLFNNIISYSEYPPIVPPIMAKAWKGERKKAGGFMVASDDNKDIVPPMMRPDIDDDDLAIYKDIAKELELDYTLADNDSYMQFMNYNQICYLEFYPMPKGLFQ